MGSWLSSSNGANGATITEHDRAILDLKAQRDRLEVYVKKLDLVRDREAEAAKKLLKEGKRAQAQLCLKKRKFQEVLIHRSEQMYLNLQQLVESVEFATVQSAVFDQLKKGAHVLKALQAEMSVEAVEELMDDTREALEYQKEIDSMLSQNLSPEDEEDVLAELDALTEATESDFAKPQPAAAAPVPAPSPVAAVESSPQSESVEISPEDMKELEELEELMQIPAAPSHAVAPAAQPERAKRTQRREAELV